MHPQSENETGSSGSPKQKKHSSILAMMQSSLSQSFDYLLIFSVVSMLSAAIFLLLFRNRAGWDGWVGMGLCQLLFAFLLALGVFIKSTDIRMDVA